MNGMISESEALGRIFSVVKPGPAESVPLGEAAGRFCRETIPARLPFPPFDHSAMDGYAIHEADCGQTERWLKLVGTQPAGPAQGLRVAPGHVVRIFTGAPIPAETSSVVMQEDVEVRADVDMIRVREAAEPGEFIRRRGSDLCAGQQIAVSGELVSAQKIAVLAGQGIQRVKVGSRPRVSILTTGDEVIETGADLPHDAAIFNSNGPMLAALASAAGAESVERRHVADHPGHLAEEIRSALARSDVLVTAGGVSVGERDFVKDSLTQAGCESAIWRVALKPGKPFLFASRSRNAANAQPALPARGLPMPAVSIFGLPGNPVSAFVTFCVFVAPALRLWQGARPDFAPLPKSFARLVESLANRGDRPHYLRVICGPDGSCRSAGLQESHAVYSLSRANALVRLPPRTSFPSGSWVEVVRL
jgi:molybdopterin molybdotransferase